MLEGGYGQIGYDPQPYPPNDPLYQPSGQFPLGQHWIGTTRVDRAWRLVGYHLGYTVQHGDPNATIAIINTGIQTGHPEFANKLHSESHSVLVNGPPSNPAQYCDCDTFRLAFGYDVIDDLVSFGHRTKTAGLAAGLGNNCEGLAGVCWDCPILMLRVFAQEHAPSECSALFGTFECVFNEFTIAQAIRYAAGWNALTGQYNQAVWARVISIASKGSFYEGLCDLENDVKAAIDEAYDRGVVIVAIAGNSDDGCASTEDCTWDGTPAGSIRNGLALQPNTITVGGVCSSGTTWHCRSRINPLCAELPNGTSAANGFTRPSPVRGFRC